MVGRLSEIHGIEGSGLTSVALKASGSALAQGHKVLYLDLDFAICPDILDLLGIPKERHNFFLFEASTLETCLLAMQTGTKLLVLDSLRRFLPYPPKEGEDGSLWQNDPYLYSLRLLSIWANTYQCAVLLVNPQRFLTDRFPTIFAYRPHIRVHVERKHRDKDGLVLRAKVVKNTCASAHTGSREPVEFALPFYSLPSQD